MANQNLSQFTEKTFVADADHTFIWDTAASISKRVSRNSWLSGTTADFHLGLADAASPVAQTISVQSVVAGTSNTAGANLSINGSQGTGTGAGGSLLLRTAPAGSSGTAQNALVTAVAITSAGNVGIGTTSPTSKLEVYLNPAASYTTETVKFGNIHFANGTGGYSNLWMGSISTPLTLSASNYTLANDGTNTIINGGSGGLFFHVSAQAHWNIQNSTGHFLCASDNSRDIGASGANRPRNVYVGSDVICGSLRAVNINTANNSHTVLTFTNSSDNLLFASGQTSSRINFCGTTNLFPAIKRSSTTLQARLADDSAFAPIQGKLTTDTAYTATVVAATGYITIYDSIGTAYRVPCAV